MHCYRCDAEAVDRCYTCGALFCAAHGDVNCERCDTAVAAGDVRPDRIAARPMPANHQTGWWRPQRAEDFTPPACYQCHGLARRSCRNCGNYFCPEHAGNIGLCVHCDRSSIMGLYILFGILIALAVMVWVGF